MPKIRWVVSTRSKHLMGRATSDTKPEILLRKTLYRLGARYRLNHYIVGRFKADIAFLSKRVAVMVDGCFWHGCPRHGRTHFNGPNATTWVEKIQGNRDRDTRATKLMQGQGWTVIRVWECDVKEKIDDVASEVLAALDSKKG